ncbi:cytokinin riboside 5'-monophosphate phosphoribohydrolase isoform X2 [Jatropha curcas]|uniref:cytokinin riboside 5'-monophosphate phosphoribohydrolase isoform X2 n=1 Tax=Jatropha curcas TaxID=180498 RepID=UPI0005FBBB07|nr:cytokinin riboside 5'-monophosphate phosphoribohydrolase isoform X2 [Jatropha curcas]
MGFPLVLSWGSHIMARSFCDYSIKLRSFNENERFGGVKVRSSNFKPSTRRISLCKNKLVDFDERTSPNEVRREIERCYNLIQRLGRGVVYLGSSRMGPDHPHYLQVLELGREVAKLLDCTSWTGAGPGLMDAAIKGALEAGKPVGGFKIAKEAGEWTASNFHAYLPSETYLTCRKHGLVDAAVRNNSSDKTAVVALPGGIGTLDEMFEILALIQLERIGSELPVPFIVMNYDSFYQKLLDFIQNCEDWGTVSRGEVASLWKVCNNNSDALAYLTDFYNIHSSSDEDRHDKKLTTAP